MNDMTQDKQHSRPNVPPLRFPGFTEPWQRTKLGSLTTKVGSGSTPRGGNSVYTTSGHCFVRSQNVGMGNLLLDDIAYIDEQTHQKQKSTEIKENDVLLNITGASIGRTALATKEIDGGNVNQHVCIIRPSERVIPNFICYYIQLSKTQRYIQSLQTGGSREGLNFDQVRSFPISYPNYYEQIKVVQLLDLIDRRIAVQNKIIEDLRQLKSALYQQVFSSINGKLVALKTVANIIKGKQINGTELSESGPYYVMNGGIVPSGYYDECNTKANTISISEGGNSCGYVQYNNMPFWSGGHCYTLNLKSDIVLRYLFHFLKYHEQDIMALRIGSGLPNIQKKDLERFQILLPNQEKQRYCANIFDCIEAKETIDVALLKVYQSQNQFLLQQMFI